MFSWRLSKGFIISLTVFLFEMPSLSSAFRITISKSSNITTSSKTFVNNFGFMYPYEIYEIYNNMEPSPEYLFVKIDPSFASNKDIKTMINS